MRRFLLTPLVLALGLLSVWAQPAKDTTAAAATRKTLQTKLTVDYSDKALAEVAKDLTKKVKDAGGKLNIQIDTSGGVSLLTGITFKGKDRPLAEILDKMFAKNDLGYIVISGSYRNYKKHDGYLLIVKGSERGYPAGQEPKKDK